jgi:uncharacterized protein DUF4440
MSLRFAVGLIGLAAFGCARAQSVPQPAQAALSGNVGEEREVVRAVERLFEGMRTQDTAMLGALLAPELDFVYARDSAGRWLVDHYSRADFLSGMAEPGNPAEELRERMWDPEVRVDGVIATVWTEYDFHVGSRFSHCGHDAFHLARGQNGWYMTAITYTARPQPCPSQSRP